MENVVYIFAYHFANVGMKSEVPFYNVLMYLYDKNILEFAQIAQTEPKSMIQNIEGRSNLYKSLIDNSRRHNKLHNKIFSEVTFRIILYKI